MTLDDHILTTNGIKSHVYDDDGDQLGHVLFGDYDGGFSLSQLEEEVDGLPGVTLVFESSSESYHVWNLTVRTKEQTGLKMLEIHCDPSYKSPGFRRGYWRLRVGAKKRPNTNVYKEAPELISVVINTTDRPQSRSHWEFATAKHDIPEMPVPIQWVGEGIDTEAYDTLTEWGKSVHQGEADPDDPPN